MDNFLLKLKTIKGHIILKPSLPVITIGDLKSEISKTTNIVPQNLCILHGFPPKKLDLDEDTNTLKSNNINSGDTLIIEERVMDTSDESESRHKAGVDSDSESDLDEHGDVDPSIFLVERDPGRLRKKVVPADNSCLFTSIGFVIGGHVDVTSGTYMRQIVSEEIRRNPFEFNSAILGRPNHEYSRWILHPDSWGGAIELAVLSKFFGVEIAVVNIVNGNVNRFGEDQFYDHRVFILFDGCHYDPLYWDSKIDEKIKTIFPVLDDVMLEHAEALALAAQASHQFTDVNKFILKCQICDENLVGEAEAVRHAQQTGHQNFGEIMS